MKTTLEPRRTRFLTDASLIAGITGGSYLVALAFRSGQLAKAGLPVSLATVSLTDAGFAGLLVLVGGVAALSLIDYVESNWPGAVERVLAALLILSFLPVLALGVLLLTILVPLLSTVVGLPWAMVAWALAEIATTWAWWRFVRWLVDANPRLDLVHGVFRRFPGVAVATALAFVLCISAWLVGYVGVPEVLGQPVLVSVQTSEIALLLSDQRAILAEVEAMSSHDATLTGRVRIVPMPSSEITLTATKLTTIHPPRR